MSSRPPSVGSSRYRDSTGCIIATRGSRHERVFRQDRMHRDLELLSEAFSVFVRLWFAHTPSVPVDAKPVARSTAESRYKQFVEHVVQQFSGGRRFLDDLPREVAANDAELNAIAA